MKTMSKLFFSFLFCLALTLMSGCGGGNQISFTAEERVQFTADEQVKIQLFFTGQGHRGSDVDVKVVDNDGRTLLHKAVGSTGNVPATTFLISRGSDVNAKAEKGETPLHIATRRLAHFEPDRIEVVKILVSAGADVNAKSKDDTTPLHEATRGFGSVEVVKLLVSKGADVNAKNKDGWTPLYLAIMSIASNESLEIEKIEKEKAEMGKIEIIKLLVSAGADVNAKVSGGTLLDSARISIKGEVKKAIIDYLESEGAKSDLPAYAPFLLQQSR